jgi:SPP1 gp7 family putative phage head morphogenesis protein
VRNAEYWKIRFAELEEASNRYGLDTYAQIEPTFDSAQRKIQKEIEAWYGRYARNNGITMQEARKQLTTAELKELRWDVKQYIKYGKENALNQQWMKELENASARVHINRLEALKLRTQQFAEVAFGNQLDCIDAMARKVFTEDYYHSIFEIQKGFGIGWEIGQIDQKKLDKFVKKPWALDGKHFSARIWQQRGQLVTEIHQQLTRTCILGKAPDDAIKAISKKFGTTKSNAGRLVMTEQAYFHSVAQKEAFNDLDVEEFEIVATLDHETSEICQEMDGKHFPMSTYEAGVTAPPFHPWCRSVTVPYFEDNFTGERVARNADGETYYVPDNMTYKEWKKGMVDGDTDGLTPVDPSSAKAPVDDFVEITDAIDFGYGDYTKDDYIKWWDDYEAHNSGVHLSKEELSIIEDYTEGGFIGLNDVCRYSDSELLKKGYSAEDIARLRKKADTLDGALSKYDLDTDIVTHRFERDVSWLTGNGNGVEELEKLIGTEYTADGFTSSGMLPNRFRFSGGKDDAVHFEIVTPSGTNGAFLSMSKKGENEFLYNRGTKFRILDGGERIVKEQKFNIKTMKVEEVEIKERFLKVQVIPDAVDDVIEEVKNEVVQTMVKAEKMEASNFPSAFLTRSEKENTEKFVEYVNSLEGANADTIKLYNSMGKLENLDENGIPFKISHASKHSVRADINLNGELVGVKLTIPKLTGDDLAGQVDAILHEEMHLIDFYCRTNPNMAHGWYSESVNSLSDVFNKTSADMSDDVSALFKELRKEYDKTKDAVRSIYKQKRDALKLSYYPNNESIWDDISKYKQYQKEAKKIDKWFDDELHYRSRNLMGGGVNALQDIYDALSGGRYSDSYVVLFGHGSKYYSSTNNRVIETLANYGSLSVTRPDLIDLLRKDKPDLVDELEETVKNMLKLVGE